MWFAVINGIAASAYQAWSANIFTTVSDMFPKRAIGSVTGIGGMVGGLGGILIARAAGQLFDIMFFICGSAYLIGWIIMHFLVPKLKPIQI